MPLQDVHRNHHNGGHVPGHTPRWLLWIGGIVGFLAMGLVRLAAKWFGPLGLSLSILILTGVALALVFRYVLPLLDSRPDPGDRSPDQDRSSRPH